MPLLKLVRTLLIMSLLSACKTDPPVHTPYLNVPTSSGLCAKYKLVNADTLTYQFDSYQPCSDLKGGYCLPPGQFEALDAWARTEIQNCAQDED